MILGMETSYTGEAAARQGRMTFIIGAIMAGIGVSIVWFFVLLSAVGIMGSARQQVMIALNLADTITHEAVPTDDEWNRFYRSTPGPRNFPSATHAGGSSDVPPSMHGFVSPSRKSDPSAANKTVRAGTTGVEYHLLTRDKPNGTDECLAPEGGFLVGLDVELADAESYPLVGIRPIFEIQGRRETSKLLGNAGSRQQRLEAEPGHAVIGINFFRGAGIQLVSAPLTAIGAVNNAETKLSELTGRKSNWGVHWQSNVPVVGIRTSLNRAWASLNDMGVYTANVRRPPTTQSKGTPAPIKTDSPEPLFRTWSSADNKYQVEGKFIKKI